MTQQVLSHIRFRFITSLDFAHFTTVLCILSHLHPHLHSAGHRSRQSSNRTHSLFFTDIQWIPDQLAPIWCQGISNHPTWAGLVTAEVRSWRDIFIVSNRFFRRTKLILSSDAMAVITLIEAETKLPLFHRRHFQVYFLEWKCMNFA